MTTQPSVAVTCAMIYKLCINIVLSVTCLYTLIEGQWNYMILHAYYTSVEQKSSMSHQHITCLTFLDFLLLISFFFSLNFCLWEFLVVFVCDDI